MVVLVALLVLSRVHLGTNPGTSSTLGNNTTPAATIAPTRLPTTAPTVAPTAQPGITPTQPVVVGQPTATPPSNLSKILTATVTGSQDYSCNPAFNRSTFTVGTTVYVNTCITAGGGTATIQATLFYQDGQPTNIESHWTDQGGKTSSLPLSMGSPHVGTYKAIVTYNGYVAKTFPITIQSN